MIIELLLLNMAIYLGMGWVLGLMQAWNMKVFIGVFTIMIIFFIVMVSISGTQVILESSEKWYIQIYNIAMVVIGIELGKFSYNEMK